jgi:trans-aconitate methyltransferase
MSRTEHWDAVFASKREDGVSWFEAMPTVSLRLMEAAGLTQETCVFDVGGGDSNLVEHLAARGLECLAVLDVSGAALQRARNRMRSASGIPIWIEADVTSAWVLKPMDIWHDRAAFHFLIVSSDRAEYRSHLLQTLKPGGTAIIATFAPDGPDKCSGLPVIRYSPETLQQELGPLFDLVESVPHIHRTPWGTTQSFQYSRFKRIY